MTDAPAGAPSAGADVRALHALAALERNRQQVRAAFLAPAASDGDVFPRSATFRWLSRHVSPRALLTAAASAALTRMPLARVLGSVLFKHRP